MGRSAEGQLVKGQGPSQRGAASNQVERENGQRGREQPQKARPPTSVPFLSTYTFSSHVCEHWAMWGAPRSESIRNVEKSGRKEVGLSQMERRQ